MTCETGNLSRALLAFIVDQYLSRNQFFQTRASFRNEASSLFANASPNQNLLSLEEMMNQYIFMKKQNIVLDKEKVMLMQEKNRIQTLLQDMQNALDIFNARSLSANSALVPPIQNSNTTTPVASTSTVFPVQNIMSLPPKLLNNVNFSSPMIRIFDKKRKDNPIVYGSAVAKKPCGRPPGKKKQVQGINMSLPSSINKVDFGSSSATPQSLVGNFAVRASHISTNVCRPTDISPIATCNGEVIVPSYNVISTTTKRVMVESQEQVVYKEGNSGISPPEVDCAETNKATESDTADKTSISALDVNSSHILENLDNEIPISESEKERDYCAHLDFSNKGLYDWSEIEDSFTNIGEDLFLELWGRLIKETRGKMKMVTVFTGNMKRAAAGLRHINLDCLRWRVFDAKGQVLGRLASQIATVVQGKDKLTYTPNREDGDMCIVLNAMDICVNGRKLTDKVYYWHTGYIGHLKERTLKDQMAKDPTEVIRKAVLY